MKAPQLLQVTVGLFTGCSALLYAEPAAVSSFAYGATGITAVSSRVSKEYIRSKLPDGSFIPEEYAFGNGGRYDGPFRDPSIEKLGFLDIARVIAVSLRAQNYLPARDLKTERLLIMVHWGTTIVPEQSSMSVGSLELQSAQDTASISSSGGAFAAGNAHEATQTAYALANMQNSMEARQRDQTDLMNAKLLGYDSDGLIGTDYGDWIAHFGVTGLHRDELISEIEGNRYFVVLIAYDFQVYLKQKKLKALWETRFSINEPSNDFTKALPVMAQYASRYFGQASHGLLRTLVPDGRVNVGEPKSLGEVDGPEK
jgi:hypothetical protein